MAVSSANSHENINLELPMAWEPWESSGATRSRQAARYHFGISVGDEMPSFDVGGIEGADYWRFTGLYDHPFTENQIWSWNLLRNLANKASINRMVGGDFNELIHIHEKWEVSSAQSDKFETSRKH